jgi:hypothetical protein
MGLHLETVADAGPLTFRLQTERDLVKWSSLKQVLLEDLELVSRSFGDDQLRKSLEFKASKLRNKSSKALCPTNSSF